MATRENLIESSITGGNKREPNIERRYRWQQETQRVAFPLKMSKNIDRFY